MSEAFVRKAFLASAAFLAALAVFSYGLIVGKQHIWPYATISSAWQAAKTFLEFGEFVPEGRRVRAPAGASRDPVRFTTPTELRTVATSSSAGTVKGGSTRHGFTTMEAGVFTPRESTTWRWTRTALQTDRIRRTLSACFQMARSSLVSRGVMSWPDWMSAARPSG